MTFKTSDGINVPTVTAADMRLVDDHMVDTYNIELLQMMENAGRNLADLAEDFLETTQRETDSLVTVLVGPGGNGGGGLVAARHLHNRGYPVSIIAPVPSTDFAPTTQHQADILEAMGISITTTTILGDCQLILDCLLGYSLIGNPQDQFATIITVANDSGVPILSLDTPSGLDVTSGTPHVPCIQARATMTLALPKTGFLKLSAQPYLGDVYLADISVPPALYRTYLHLDVSNRIFSQTRVLLLSLNKTDVP